VAGVVKKMPPKLYSTKTVNRLVEQNTYERIMFTMYKQCAMDFPNFPQPKDLDIDNLLFHYELCIPDIIKYQKEK
jgi:hypothetical protein